jgi:hypothetical protein
MENIKIKPDFIYHNDEPIAAVLKMKDYQKIMLDLEELEDIKKVKSIKKRGIELTDLRDYLASRGL